MCGIQNGTPCAAVKLPVFFPWVREQIQLAQADRTDFHPTNDGSADADRIVAGSGQQRSELLFTPGGTPEGVGWRQIVMFEGPGEDCWVFYLDHSWSGERLWVQESFFPFLKLAAPAALLWQEPPFSDAEEKGFWELFEANINVPLDFTPGDLHDETELFGVQLQTYHTGDHA